jgi:hypothetical protein
MRSLSRLAGWACGALSAGCPPPILLSPRVQARLLTYRTRAGSPICNPGTAAVISFARAHRILPASRASAARGARARVAAGLSLASRAADTPGALLGSAARGAR